MKKMTIDSNAAPATFWSWTSCSQLTQGCGLTSVFDACDLDSCPQPTLHYNDLHKPFRPEDGVAVLWLH